MAWTKESGTCKNGPCPAIHRDDVTDRVRVQGTEVAAHVDMPGFEAMLEYTGEEWSDLLTQQLERHPEFVRAYVEQHPEQARQWLATRPE